MDKLIRFLIGAVIAAVVMYIIGFIISLILIAVISIVLKVADKYRPEWGDWKFHRATAPLITIENGQEFFQERTVYVRTNRKTGLIETKLETNVIKKPVSQATRTYDIIYFANRLPRYV